MTVVFTLCSSSIVQPDEIEAGTVVYVNVALLHIRQKRTRLLNWTFATFLRI